MLEHWESILAIISTTIGCCWFFRRETKEQIRDTKERMEKSEIETRSLIASVQNESKEFREKWAEESKDFHARLAVQDAEFKTFLREYMLSRKG